MVEHTAHNRFHVNTSLFSLDLVGNRGVIGSTPIPPIPQEGFKTESVVDVNINSPLVYSESTEQGGQDLFDIQLSQRSVTLHELLEFCDMGWFIELYLSPNSCKYYGIERDGDNSVIETWKKRGINLDHSVFLDGYYLEDKIIYAYLWKFDGSQPDKN